MPAKNTFQKIEQVLNTSSETFMLLALLGLFIIPIAVAKSVEPMVRDTSTASSNVYYSAVNPTPLINSQSSEVLGVSTTRSVDDDITEDSIKLQTLNRVESAVIDGKYFLSINHNKAFKRLHALDIKNSGNSPIEYQINLIINGDPKLKSNMNKVVFINGVEYSSDSGMLPATIAVDPGSSVSVDIMSLKSAPTDMTVSVAFK